MRKIEGAGGTKGGFGNFFSGLGMLVVGFYLLLNKIVLTSTLGMGSSLYSFRNVANTSYNVSVTSGMIFIPMIFGIMMVFYNAKSIWGWLLFGLSAAAMIFGVIASVQLRIQSMTAFDAVTIFILAFGGLALFLRSLKNVDASLGDTGSAD
jgi:uncharacterized protein